MYLFQCIIELVTTILMVFFTYLKCRHEVMILKSMRKYDLSDSVYLRCIATLWFFMGHKY
jgi:hypothetical protein